MGGELNKDEKDVKYGTESAPVAPSQWVVRIGAPIKSIFDTPYPRASTHHACHSLPALSIIPFHSLGLDCKSSWATLLSFWFVLRFSSVIAYREQFLLLYSPCLVLYELYLVPLTKSARV